MRQNLITELSKRVILADGAMGSRLFDKGADPTTCFDLLNLDNPALVNAVHTEYLDAGAEVLETNTFGANAIKLEAYGLAHKVSELNIRGAELARKAADTATGHVWVAGSMGPLGRMDEPLPDHRVTEVYTEQAKALAEGGADVLIIETFPRLEMLLLALAAAKEATNLPVVTQMVFTGQGGSLSGQSPQDSFAAMIQAGADVVGINCGMGPQGALKVLRRSGTPEKPLSVMPNAGFPEQSGDRLLYNSSPEYFATAVMRCVSLGARLVGGCCGTGPAHIAALRKLLDERDASAPLRTLQTTTATPSQAMPLADLPPSEFSRKLGTKKMVLVEIDPPKHLDITPALQGAEALANAGVDAITVAENPLAVPRLSNITLAGMIRRRTGAEVVVHLTGRDRNLVGTQSTVMGLAAQGLQNVLAVTGDPPPAGSDDVIKGVFDLRSFELIELLERFNQGENRHGDPMRMRAGFAIGAAFNPNTKNPALQVKRMERKIECGARYFLTQPVYTRGKVDEVVALTRHIDTPIHLGIMPLASARNAEFLHNEFPGITIPDDIRARMHDAGDNGAQVGADIAWELIEYAWDHFAGIYIMPPFNRTAVALDLVNRLRDKGLWTP
ncbi:bifunctional homocysteine S-methyltransferase/methylenetetrahydrofolate reductase [Desulfovibrio ferrophilus]|uniref:Methylenetetrahydrofolate reductase n=1 Tax=Desulfovibrio ferrophilus TaxID=241368 RepID=A0A2Z6AYL3_9BACT|nr:bifunctional homocysteine S-methyltransferase/methylenetetrahydrofolate reductase [Desulfovibrio ferrophilus]BBD08351.1 methylenetetrahydrofolate reductase [Desulfovibrio ferrophilus]